MYEKFLKRISWKKDIKELLLLVCEDFGLGQYKNHSVITVGYEDLNIVLETNSGSYFVKALANFRDDSGRQRYLQIMNRVNEAGVNHPKLFKSEQGYLHKVDSKDGSVYLFVMQYVDGKTYFDLKVKPNKDEIKVLAHNAALINKIDLKPKYVYDSWAVVNFVKEYGRAKSHMDEKDINLIEPVLDKFKKLNLESLPKSFVHGDIINTNVIKGRDGKIWIIDFSVSNYYPRIQEMAVLACDLLSDFSKPGLFESNLKLALDEYQKELPLTDTEMDNLPLYINAAHAMHIIGSTNSAVKEGDFEENQHWMNKGRKGLEYTSNIWK